MGMVMKMMKIMMMTILMMMMMETSSFACVLIFLPAVVGLFAGPPPWSTFILPLMIFMIYDHDDHDDDDFHDDHDEEGEDDEDWHLVVSKQSLDEGVS